MDIHTNLDICSGAKYFNGEDISLIRTSEKYLLHNLRILDLQKFLQNIMYFFGQDFCVVFYFSSLFLVARPVVLTTVSMAQVLQ